MLEVRVNKLGAPGVFTLHGRTRHVTVLLLDLGGVTVVDAAGLGVMLEVREELEAKGIALKLTNTSYRVNQIFEITRLNTVFEITSHSAVSPLDRVIQVNDLSACA